jgi:hypothetical protein
MQFKLVHGTHTFKSPQANTFRKEHYEKFSTFMYRPYSICKCIPQTSPRGGPVETDRNDSYGDIPEQALYIAHYGEVEQAILLRRPSHTARPHFVSVHLKGSEPLLGHHLHRTKRQTAPIIKGRRGRMCSTLVSYSGGLWVKPQPGDRIS